MPAVARVCRLGRAPLCSIRLAIAGRLDPSLPRRGPRHNTDLLVVTLSTSSICAVIPPRRKRHHLRTYGDT